MTTGNKIMWKTLFNIILYNIFLTSGVKLHIHLLNVVVQFIVFLTFSTLICRSTDISKCFSESLGIRYNESRLYLTLLYHRLNFRLCWVSNVYKIMPTSFCMFPWPCWCIMFVIFYKFDEERKQQLELATFCRKNKEILKLFKYLLQCDQIVP